MKVCQSCLTLCDPWTVAHQGPLSMDFSRQEYWSGLPFLFPGDLLDAEIEPISTALQADFLPSEPPGKTVGLKRNVQLQLLRISGLGTGLDYYDIEWFVLETNQDHPVVFETAHNYRISDSFVDYEGCS